MMRAWEIISEGGIAALALNQRADPEPGPGQVLVKVGASAINYRDLVTLKDPKSRGIVYPLVPNSDCAGTVVSVGGDVSNLTVGDRVIGCFFQDWTDGPISPVAMASALGGAIDGVLAEKVVLNAAAVVAVPDNLTLDEASTLPCAGLTAWHALTEAQPVKPGDRVLLLGTGGVSVFAQQFCSALGVETIVTSSSDEKLAKMRTLGAQETINYTKVPAWEEKVLALTNGVGVDRVVEVGGPGTLQKSLAAVRVGGAVQLIGILTGASGTIVPTDIMRKSISLRGIYVGSCTQFEAMAAFISDHKIQPVIDSIFAFEDAPSAYQKMQNATHLGKLVIHF